MTRFATMWIKFMFTLVPCIFSPHWNPAINHFGGFLIVKNKLTSLFLCLSSLIDDNSIGDKPKVAVEIILLQLVTSTATLTMLWCILSSIRGQVQKKTKKNLTSICKTVCDSKILVELSIYWMLSWTLFDLTMTRVHLT